MHCTFIMTRGLHHQTHTREEILVWHLMSQSCTYLICINIRNIIILKNTLHTFILSYGVLNSNKDFLNQQRFILLCVFVTHLPWFCRHMQPIMLVGQCVITLMSIPNTSAISSAPFLLDFVSFVFSTASFRLQTLISNFSNPVFVMSSVLTGIARSTSGRMRRPEKDATSPTGTGKCSHIWN